VVGDHAYLVDDWVAGALAPAPLALRETRPFADIASAQTIVIDRLVPFQFAVRIEGTPRRLVRPIELALDPQHVDALQRALSELTIIDVPTKPGFVTTTFTIDAPRLITIEERADADCPHDATAISGTFGPGCIALAQWGPVEAAIAKLRQPSRLLADRRLLPFDPVQLTLPDGAILDLAKRPRIGDRDADPTRVAELLATLGAHYDIGDTTTTQPIATLVATSRTNATVTLELLANRRVRRKGEPVDLAVGAGAWDVLMRAASQLRDPTPWTEEPTTIRAITIDKTTFTRGAVIGEWSGAKDGASIEALARMLAKPRVTASPRAPARILHTVALEIAAPGVAPVTHRLTLGEGCRARVGDDVVVLDAALCGAIAELSRAGP
jgi:hypothetical protein